MYSSCSLVEKTGLQPYDLVRLVVSGILFKLNDIHQFFHVFHESKMALSSSDEKIDMS